MSRLKIATIALALAGGAFAMSWFGSGDVSWDEYNAALEEMCREKGAGYIDISSRLKDEEGYLAAEYSQGDGYHLNTAGIALWVDALKDYAQAQYDAGLWTPEE